MAELFEVARARGEKRANAIFFHGLDGDAHKTWQAALAQKLAQR
jgi:predicted alpha/beta-fold hydrolase